MRAAYDGEVWYTDQQIGRLLELVAARAVGRASTAIVVTSDHGEAFGEHHMIRHGFELWEELVRVPLLFHVPGVAPHHVARPAQRDRSGADACSTSSSAPAARTRAVPFDFLSGHSLAADIVLAAPATSRAERDILVDMPAGPNNDERRAFIHDGKKLYVASCGALPALRSRAAIRPRKNALDDKDLFAEAKARYQALQVAPARSHRAAGAESSSTSL